MISRDPISRTPTFSSQVFLGTYPRSTAQVKPGVIECPFDARMMPRSRCYARALFVLLAMMFGIAASMRFEVDSGHGKCISEEIKANAMTVGKYSIVNPNEGQTLPDDYRITVKVGSLAWNFLSPLRNQRFRCPCTHYQGFLGSDVREMYALGDSFRWHRLRGTATTTEIMSVLVISHSLHQNRESTRHAFTSTIASHLGL